MDAITDAAGSATHCPYCALQCGVTVVEKTVVEKTAPEDARFEDAALESSAAGSTAGYEVRGRAEFPVNEGALCGKGATAGELLRPEVRLAGPLLRDRKGAPLRPASWDEALDRIAQELDTRDPRAVAVFGGGSLTNEKAYQLGRFARAVLRTPNIDYNGRFCMSSVAAAQNRAFGVDRGLPFPVRDIRGAGTVLLVGANPADTMPPIMRHFAAAREAGGRVIVIDPRRTRTAESADLHLQPVPGTDLALALGMLDLVVAEGIIEEEHVAACL